MIKIPLNSIDLQADLSAVCYTRLILINTTHSNTFNCIASYCFFQAVPLMNPGHLCSVPMGEAPGDAMSKCSGDIQGEGPASRHKTTRKKHNKMIMFCRSSIVRISLDEFTENLR